MTTYIQKLDPDAAIDLAYDIFLEIAGENLDPADIMLFNLQFEDRGAVEFVETADDWEQEIDRKSTRLNSSHVSESRMPSSA